MNLWPFFVQRKFPPNMTKYETYHIHLCDSLLNAQNPEDSIGAAHVPVINFEGASAVQSLPIE
jgi:hypothetical protein